MRVGNFYRDLRNIGRVTGDEFSYDYEVRSSLSINGVVREILGSLEKVQPEPWAETPWTPGAKATIVTPEGMVVVFAEGWSDECERAVDGDVMRGGKAVLKRWWNDLGGKRGWTTHESVVYDDEKRVTLLIVSRPSRALGCVCGPRLARHR